MRPFSLRSFLTTTLSVGLMFSATDILAQANGSLVGKVTDDVYGNPMQGARIVLKGSKRGGITRPDGTYKIENLKPAKYSVEISFVGYAAFKRDIVIEAGKETKLDAVLEFDLMKLEDVVVVGYGTSQKRELTGSYTSVKAAEIVSTPTPSIEGVLQGRAPGVQIVQSNGMAGSPITVRVRGVGSITAGSDPLFVIDGIPMTTGDFGGNVGGNTNALADLNPNDIESMEVLKDADATAIYGSRGANGVVLITTKRGKAGAARINFNYNQGFVTPTNKLELLDAPTWIDLYYEAWANDERAAGREPDPARRPALPQGFTPETAANTDWLDQVLRVGQSREASLSVSGGNDMTRYYIGATYRNEEGYTLRNNFERISGRITLDHKASDDIEIGGSVNITRSINDRVGSAWAGGIGAAQSTALPIYPVFNEDGTYFQPQSQFPMYNPVADLENRKFQALVFRTLGNAYFQWNIIPGLTYRSEIGVDLLNQREERFASEVIDAVPNSEDRRVEVFNWTTNNYFNFSTDIDKDHSINATAGMAVQQSQQYDAGLTGQQFPNDFFTNPGTGAVRNGFASQQAFGFVSYFGRLKYAYQGKYLFSASVSRDGSSRFGPNNRFGIFPSFGIGWIMSDEEFLKDNEVLTFLKLRASYGLTGNAEIGNYTWQGLFGTGQYNGGAAVVPDQLSNPDLTWESSRNLDMGIDFGLLRDKVSGTISYFRREVSDMLLNVAVPASTGMTQTTVIRNVGAMLNQGVEFNISTYNFSGEFEWKTDFNITYITNEVTDNANLPPDAIAGPGETRVLVGKPAGTYYLVRYAGVNPQTGAPQYLTKDGQITETWSTEHRVAVGQPYPDFYGGLTNTFRYKGFELSFLFNFSFGNKIYDDAGKRLLGNIGFQWNQVSETLNRWQKPGDVTDVPRLSLRENRDINSDQHLHDGSFVRLRNLTLAYNLPSDIIKDFGLNGVRVYFTGVNLLTFTSYPGWDPELVRDFGSGDRQARNLGQSVTYLVPPQAKSFIVGMNLEF